MTDPARSASATRVDAALAVARLEAMSAQFRGCVILGPDGDPIASTGEFEPWAEAARALMEAAQRTAQDPTHVHVGTEGGEVFAVRHEGYTLVVAADRFALASLLFFDMRAVLRDLVSGSNGSR